MPGTADSRIKFWFLAFLKAWVLSPQAKETSFLGSEDVHLTWYSVPLVSSAYGGVLDTPPVKVTASSVFQPQALLCKTVPVFSESLQVHSFTETAASSYRNVKQVPLPLKASAEKHAKRCHFVPLPVQFSQANLRPNNTVCLKIKRNNPLHSLPENQYFLQNILATHSLNSFLMKRESHEARPWPANAFLKPPGRKISLYNVLPNVQFRPSVLNGQPLVKLPLPLPWLPLPMKEKFQQKLAEKIHCLPENILLQFVYDRLVPIYYTSVSLSDSGQLFCMLKPRYQLGEHYRRTGIKQQHLEPPPLCQFLAIGIDSTTNKPVQTLISHYFPES